MISQAFSFWCLTNRGVEPEKLLAGAAKIGYDGIDLIGEDLWPLVKKHGLKISAVNGHGTLTEGLAGKKFAKRCEAEIRTNIEKAEKWKIPVLVCLSGNRAGMTDKKGIDQCAEVLGKVAKAAEDAGVLLALELLNSKVDHKDYICDRTAWGVEVIKKVNSPAVKLLYDIYHMQIMEGDIIRTIKAEHQHFGHYHTGGNPGRHELDENQEIYYPPIYKAIAATGYKGFISHEFIPTGDPIKAMRTAFKDCQKALT